MNESPIAILGAGSWGTAVAIHLAKQGHHVLLWAHHADHVTEMLHDRANKRYLANPFPDTLQPTADLGLALAKAVQVIIAVPSHAFSGLIKKIPKPKHGLSWLTKGLDPSSHKLLSQITTEQFGQNFPVGIISGPSFAQEVANSLPTAVTLASNNLAYQKTMQKILHQGNLRVYLTNDLIGVQISGAVKNVLAIACGISDGLGYGANARAALITRGLAEMVRLGIKMGAKEDTFMGLAGMGDLVLTCTDNQSRNRRFGILVGQGIHIADAERQIAQVVEGKYNAEQVCILADQHAVDMPICTQVHDVLQGKTTAKKAVIYLMERKPREE